MKISILTIMVALGFGTAFAQQPRQLQGQGRPVHPQLQNFDGIGPDSLANVRYPQNSNRGPQPLRNFRNIAVPVDNRGNRAPLGDVVDQVFAEHNQIRSALDRVPNAAFFNGQRPLFMEPVKEDTPTGYLVIQETRMIVQSPKMLAAVKGLDVFRASQSDSNNKAINVEQLLISGNGPAKQGLDAYIQELSQMNAHPLKALAEAGDRKGLIEAIAEGKGDLTITTTVHIPKDHARPMNAAAEALRRPSTNRADFGKFRRVDLSVRQFGETVKLRCVSHPTRAEVVADAVDMWKDGSSYRLRLAKGRESLSDDSQNIFRLESASDGLRAYHLKSAFRGGFWVGDGPRNDRQLGAVTRGDTRSTWILEGVAGKRNTYRLFDAEERKYVSINSAGYLANSTENSSQAAQFEISTANWSPGVMVKLSKPVDGVTFAVQPSDLVRGGFAIPKGARESNELHLPYGKEITVTPRHRDYVFNPPSRTVVCDGNESLFFSPAPANSGTARYDANFLAGFTSANNFEYEIAFSYPSGRFRAGAGAYLNFGFRVPIKVSGTISPTNVIRNSSNQTPANIKVKMKASGLDGDAEFYRSTGLPADEIQNGHEFVLNAGAWYRLYFEVFWKTYIDESFSKSFNYDKDFAFPVGPDDRSNVIPPIWLPPEWTFTDFSRIDDTQLGIDIVDLVVHLGARLDVTHGKPTVAFTSLADGVPYTRAQDVALYPDAEKSFTFSGSRIRSSGNIDFGARLDLKSYDFKLTATPMLKIDAPVDIDIGWGLSFRRDFSTGDIELTDFAVSTPNIPLSKHKGTRAVDNTPGKASWR